MILQLNRERKIILLRWLKQGYIDTLELPEAYKDATLFQEFLQETSIQEELEEQERKEQHITNNQKA